MKTLTLFAALLPTLAQDTPEAAARAFVDGKLREYPRSMDRRIRRTDWELRCLEKEMEWWAERGPRRKVIEEERAQLEFLRANRKKILDTLMYDIIEVSTLKDGGKQVTVKVWSYDVKRKDPGEYRLEYEGESRRLQFVLVEGKWKIKNRK